MKNLMKQLFSVKNICICVLAFCIGYAISHYRTCHIQDRNETAKIKEQNNDAPRTEKRATGFFDSIKEALIEDGYRPSITDDGDFIYFKCEGQTFLVEADSQDSLYFYMLLPRIKAVTPENKTKCLEAANKVTGNLKIVKVWIEEDSEVNISYERSCQIGDDFRALIPHAILSISGAQVDFFEELKK